ncbi:hypothetical protein BV898_09196 [Hypsibius exemplaris]|uniref:Uncharacterized protein n=1 Tax=Hypsibius exemplaris TaxID=2072580 RepID=A0A1W0WNB2_HYPEX|nr:hypothetical protein BV898_09196 [Hypsibius exemplaris]
MMEKDERRARLILLLAFVLTLAAIGLLGAAAGSEFWVEADMIKRNVPDGNGEATVSWAHHGLFSGELRRDAVFFPFRTRVKVKCDASRQICRYEGVNPIGGDALTTRPNQNNTCSVPLNVFCDASSTLSDPSTTFSGCDVDTLGDPGDLNFGIWVSTLAFLAMAAVFGLLAAVFTMINVLYVPISNVVGIAGLYIWNSIAGVCTLLVIGLWAGLFHSHLQYNIIPSNVLSELTTCFKARYGMAFWFCLVAMLLFFINMVLIRFNGLSFECGEAEFQAGWKENGVPTYLPNGQKERRSWQARRVYHLSMMIDGTTFIARCPARIFSWRTTEFKVFLARDFLRTLSRPTSSLYKSPVRQSDRERIYVESVTRSRSHRNACPLGKCASKPRSSENIPRLPGKPYYCVTSSGQWTQGRLIGRQASRRTYHFITHNITNHWLLLLLLL